MQEAILAAQTYGWWMTPFSKFNRPIKVLSALLLHGVDQRSFEDSAQTNAWYPVTTLSPGGGGPGLSPTSTKTPPSKSGSGRRPRRKCPKGYLRDPKSGRCVWWSELKDYHKYSR